ncbi:MAG: hypothetical protein KDA41_11750, partial [Planctomycetales bacterium]|nr:hypothetical protein [Planctomycetales bacterium]
AEAEFACWLSETTQLGAAPTRLDLLDQRTQHWPSFEPPQECFLFHFAYDFPQGQYANIGVAGPLVHAFHADMTGLSHDDLYAAFAGWQAEHPDIYEIPVADFSPAHVAAAARIARRLADDGFSEIAPLALGGFFGEMALVASGVREGAAGLIVAGDDEAAWLPSDPAAPRPLGAAEAWCIWKGRRLLESFNE